MIWTLAGCGVGDGDSAPQGGQLAERSCGGIGGASCPSGQACVDDPADSCDPARGGADCPGVCKAPAPRPPAPVPVPVPQPRPALEPLACGGFAATACPAGLQCVDDPTDSCDPARGGADCPGICKATDPPPPTKPPACGGFAATACPAGMQCVDDPTDSCDPARGGADCPGVCKAAAASAVAVTTDKASYATSDPARAKVSNRTGDSIFLAGCTQVSRQRLQAGTWVDQGRLVACVWEGYAIEVKPGGELWDKSELRFTQSGTWRVAARYGVGCKRGAPLSSAGCTSFATAFSPSISVRR